MTRVALGIALVVLVVVAVWDAFRLQPQKIAFLPKGTSAVVVIDMSKSVYVDAYGRVAPLLTSLANSDAPVGVVAFSDIAYELQPPRTRGSNIRPLIRFFRPVRPAGQNADPAERYLKSPWVDAFSGGTQISAGLHLARVMLARDRVHKGEIILVSDLESASPDLPALTRTLISLKRDPDVTLKIVALQPGIFARKFFEAIMGKRAFVDPKDLKFRPRAHARERVIAGVPTALAVTAVAVALLLALNELWCTGVALPGRARGARRRFA